MLRATCLSLALLAIACAPALAQNYSGTYTTTNPSGGTVTLKLKQDAQSVSGTLSGQGNTFQVQAEVQPDGLFGMVTSPGGMLYLMAQFSGAQLHVILAEPGPGGQPNLQAARQLVMTRAGRGTGSAAAAPKGAPAPRQDAGGSASDTQIAQFLSRNAWCAFSYNQRSGTSTRERVVFRGDGLVVQQSGAETYSSGYGGTMAGQHSGGNQARWRVQGGMLQFSQDGMNWNPQPLQVTQNSNGSPILKSGGKEYMVCN